MQQLVDTSVPCSKYHVTTLSGSASGGRGLVEDGAIDEKRFVEPNGNIAFAQLQSYELIKSTPKKDDGKKLNNDVVDSWIESIVQSFPLKIIERPATIGLSPLTPLTTVTSTMGTTGAMPNSNATALITTPQPEMMCGLLSRFILNLPQDELQDWNRIFYHLEHMWWFYLDHLADPPLTPGQRLHLSNHGPSFFIFAQHALTTLAGKENNSHQADELQFHLEQYEKYKRLIPVAGCALLRMTLDGGKEFELLMVRPAGTIRWGFPKGKQNEGESLEDVAIRETEEETGYRIARSQLTCHWTVKSNNSDFIHIFPAIVDKKMNASSSVVGSANLEVDDIQWIPLSDAPPKNATNLANKLWPKLLQYVQQQQQKRLPLNASAPSFMPLAAAKD